MLREGVFYMKNFVECIKSMHTERYDLVMQRIIQNKISCAFFSSASVDNALEIVSNLRKQGINITHLITIAPPPVHA